MEDEFEFKPLTEGLGFHKKVIDLKEDHSASEINFKISGQTSPASKTQGQAQAQMQSQVQTSSRPILNRPAAAASHAMSASAATSSSFHPPVTPSPAQVSKTAATQTSMKSPSRESILSTTRKKEAPLSQSFGFNAALPKAEILDTPTKINTGRMTYVPVAVSWPASIFDSTMILGMALLFSAVVFAITNIDLSDLLDMLKNDSATQIATIILVLAVLEIYAVACRSFFGKTLGEWSFEYRLGTQEQQQRAIYPLQVAWRALITSMTGFVLLPIISTIIKKDVAGMISGVSLFAEKR